MERKDVCVQCMCCGLPEYPPKDDERISHTVCDECLQIEYPEEYKQIKEERDNVKEQDAARAQAPP